MNLIVDDKDGGQRLDVWTAGKLSLSRSQTQKNIKDGRITVNGRPVSPHYALKPADTVTISTEPQSRGPLITESSVPSIIPAVDIIWETGEYIVINKPAGLLMHPAHDVSESSLVDWLLDHCPAIAKIGEDPLRPGIVHRLDREVSGLVVIAKTQTMFDLLKQQFQERTIEKNYRALVHDAGIADEGEINFRIERSAQGYKMAAKPLNQPGKIAITLFEVEKRFHNYALLKLRIKTGRTHQIRAHLSAYGHPVVGDDLYATPKFKALNKKFKLGRIFLVATDLSFLDNTGERQSFSVSLPDELGVIIEKLP